MTQLTKGFSIYMDCNSYLLFFNLKLNVSSDETKSIMIFFAEINL